MCSTEFYHHYGKFRHEVLDWKAYMIVWLKVDIWLCCRGFHGDLPWDRHEHPQPPGQPARGEGRDNRRGDPGEIQAERSRRGWEQRWVRVRLHWVKSNAKANIFLWWSLSLFNMKIKLDSHKPIWKRYLIMVYLHWRIWIQIPILIRTANEMTALSDSDFHPNTGLGHNQNQNLWM